MAHLQQKRSQGVTDMKENPKAESAADERPVRTWQALASGCDDATPQGFRLRSASGRAGKSNRGRLYDYIWIAYSFFFFIEPIQRHNFHYWLGFVAFYAAFVAAYSGFVFSTSKRFSYLTLAVLWVLGASYLPVNGGVVGVFVYVAAFIPFITDSLVVVGSVFAGLCATMIIEGYLFHLSPWCWGAGSFITLVVGGSNLLIGQKIRSHAKLSLAHEEIEHLAKIAERERIARDLHDVLGHTLSVVVLKSELAGRLVDRDPERARAEITEVEQVARRALSEVREAIRGYRTEGLAAEIERAHRTLDAAGVSLVCESKPPSLPPAEETVLSLTVREAVTNIVRHAQASQCRMRFVAENGQMCLTVEDDGRGNIRQEGNGLRGMRERIEALGGRFNIDGKQGTSLNIEIPIRSQ